MEKKLASIKPFVATIGDQIIGFAEFEKNGHIDCFYVHHHFQGKGAGTAMMNEIIQAAKVERLCRIYAEVSITAKPFFLAKGFIVINEQSIVLRGVELINFVMEKITHQA